MKRSTLSWIALSLVAAPLVLCASPARAVGNNSGELGAGGTAKGDISKEAGETDRVGVDLFAGEPIDVAITAMFGSSWTFSDPDALPLDLGVTGDRVKVKRFVAPKTGRYEFAISSADGTQGTWRFSVRPSWLKVVEVSGAGDTDLGVAMPAGGKISAKVRSVATPSLAGLVAPDQSMLVGPVAGADGVLRVPKTPVLLDGTYVFLLDVPDDVAAWTGKVRRKVPLFVPTKLDLRNGLTPISYEGDGVDKIFGARCASCHDWSRSYAGVRGRAGDSLARIRSGNMPQGSPKLPADQIALIAEWISTGMNR